MAEIPGTALRIDNYLKGDWLFITSALKKEGLEESLDGAKEPCHCCDFVPFEF